MRRRFAVEEEKDQKNVSLENAQHIAQHIVRASMHLGKGGHVGRLNICISPSNISYSQLVGM